MTRDNLSTFYDKRKGVYDFKLTPGSLYQKVFDLIKSNEKVLDVGCANGNFSGELLKKNAIIFGIEISPEMAKKSSKILKEVVIGNIETMTIPWKKGTFDTILLMDVLEHLFSPKDVLSKLQPYLKRDGKIIVTLPNVANWEVRKELLMGRFDSEKTAILEEGHIRFFTYKSANQMFKDSGFKVKKFDLVINYPLLLLKIKNRLEFLELESGIKKYFHKFFAYQYIFVLQKKMKKKIAIIGATGMLGSMMYKILKEEYSLVLLYRDRKKLEVLDSIYGGVNNHQTYRLDLNELLEEYARSPDQKKKLVKMKKLIETLLKCEKTINCSGLLKDESKKNAAMAFFTNAAFPHVLSAYLKERLIHITTDCVFDGLNGAPYNENANKNPNDIYGLSKSLGEPVKSLVLRTSFIGPELGTKNSFFEWIKSKKGKSIDGYSNHIWNGLTTKELAIACKKIISNNSKFPKNGVFHIFSTSISKYEMAVKINKKYDLKIRVKKTKSNPVDRRLSTIHSLNKLLKFKSFDDMLSDLKD